jgi:GntR family transcriptional regulator, transcriptional repressor for pyruvate dehydrogenase complex
VPSGSGPRVSILGRTEKKAERLARRILDDVLAQGLSTGAPLSNEATMLAHYGVGRITLREALRILEVQGLLTIRPGPSGGPVVAHADSRDFGRMSSLFFRAAGVRLIDLMEARNLMEVTSARLAAQQRDADGMERLRTVLKALESLQDEESNTAFLATSREFHDAVNSMSGNPAMDLVSSSFVHMVLDRMTGFAYPAARRAELTSQHIAIATAILRGNASAAERLMRDHMQAYADYAWRGGNSDAKFETVSWS